MNSVENEVFLKLRGGYKIGDQVKIIKIIDYEVDFASLDYPQYIGCMGTVKDVFYSDEDPTFPYISVCVDGLRLPSLKYSILNDIRTFFEEELELIDV